MMPEVFTIVLTSILTVLGVVVVLIIRKFLVEPIHEQSRLVGDIAYVLNFYANLYANPGVGKPEEMDEASKVLRQQASQLRARTHAIRLYNLWQSLRWVPQYKKVIQASKNLFGLSNAIHQGDPILNTRLRDEIEEWLRIKGKM